MNLYAKLAITTVATFVLLWFAAPVWAQTAPCNTVGTTTLCDPTNLDVSSPTATGSDPVLLNDSTTFTVTGTGNKTVDNPIRVYFIEPLGAPLPTITDATGVGPLGAFTIGATSISQALAFNPLDGTFDGPAVTISAGQDFGKQIGLGDASVSYDNFKAEYMALGLTVPTTFQVDDALFNVPGGSTVTNTTDFLTINGSFGLGTIITPLGVDVTGTVAGGDLSVTAFDAAWTNTGFVNTLASPVPGPLVGAGLPGLVAGAGFLIALARRRRLRH